MKLQDKIDLDGFLLWLLLPVDRFSTIENDDDDKINKTPKKMK